MIYVGFISGCGFCNIISTRTPVTVYSFDWRKEVSTTPDYEAGYSIYRTQLFYYPYPISGVALALEYS